MTTRASDGKLDPGPGGGRPRPARSTPKREAPTKVRSGRPYTAEQRDEALRLLELHGMAHAHRVTGIPKATLSRWAKAAGLELDEHARARTKAAAATVEAKAAEVRLTTVDRLERILERELTALEHRADLELLAERLVVESDVTVTSGIGGPVYTPSEPTARDALAKLELLARANPKRDTVGAATRAIHDLQLLKGDATERGAIVVRFGIPRPSAADADANAVDEADLT